MKRAEGVPSEEPMRGEPGEGGQRGEAGTPIEERPSCGGPAAVGAGKG